MVVCATNWVVAITKRLPNSMHVKIFLWRQICFKKYLVIPSREQSYYNFQMHQCLLFIKVSAFATKERNIVNKRIHVQIFYIPLLYQFDIFESRSCQPLQVEHAVRMEGTFRRFAGEMLKRWSV